MSCIGCLHTHLFSVFFLSASAFQPPEHAHRVLIARIVCHARSGTETHFLTASRFLSPPQAIERTQGSARFPLALSSHTQAQSPLGKTVLRALRTGGHTATTIPQKINNLIVYSISYRTIFVSHVDQVSPQFDWSSPGRKWSIFAQLYISLEEQSCLQLS